MFTKKMAREKLTEIIGPTEGITFLLENNILTAKGQKGEVKKDFKNPKIIIKCESNKVTLESFNTTKRSKTLIKTYKAHILNMIKGCLEGFVYKLKICSGHFPMNVSVSNNVLEIKNFLGEKIPRKVKLDPQVNIKIDGTSIVVDAPDKDKAGQVAANIEQTTRRPGFDKRIFQDGIYLIEKAGKEI
jgi:large subunit ribosomal protein L6